MTQAFPGEEGKQQIITAYLNQNYYGNQSYGVKAAVESYFGKPLAEITPAQAAIIASLPKSPSNYDLVRNAIEQCTTVVAEGDDCPTKSELIVPPDTTIVARRNSVLDLLAEGRTPMSGNQYTSAEFKAAKGDHVLLASQATPHWIAPHFVWAVRDELTERLCGPDATTCAALERGGLRVTTTLDLRLQKIAEKWVEASTLVPHRQEPGAGRQGPRLRLLPGWMANLENKDVRNGALVALDYQTGELVAYVGSAKYYATTSRPEFQPQYDVVGQGLPPAGLGVQAVQLRHRHRRRHAHRRLDAHGHRHGLRRRLHAQRRRQPRARTGPRPQRPPVLAQHPVGQDDGREQARPRLRPRPRTSGWSSSPTRPTPGSHWPSASPEVRPVDLVTAYGTLANGGKRIGHTTILTIQDRNGTDVADLRTCRRPASRSSSPQAAYIVTDILAGNTNPNVNPFWGKFAIHGTDARRPATLKTGTNNDAKDLNAYGYIAPPTDAGRAEGAYALTVGVWNGNSDNSRSRRPARRSSRSTCRPTSGRASSRRPAASGR